MVDIIHKETFCQINFLVKQNNIHFLVSERKAILSVTNN